MKTTHFLLASVSIFAIYHAQPALAQRAGIPDEPERYQDEIVVTGSFVKQSAPESIPMDIIDANDISNSSANSIVDLLSRIPATSGNLVSQNSDDQGNEVGGGINLRNLGTNATLILLNGQRQTSLRTSTDVNGLVPQVMLKRIEVLKDGASAAYGSDAIAGVVNFITDKNFEGLRLDANLVSVEAADNLGGNVGVMFGSHGDRSSVVAGIEYNRRAQLLTPDRFDSARIEEYGQRSIFGNPGSFQPQPTVGPPLADVLCGNETLGGIPNAGIPGGPFCSFDLTQRRGMIAEQSRITSFATMSYDFTSSLRGEFEAGFAHTDQSRSDGPRFPLTNNSPLPIVPASNPFNPYGQDVQAFYRVTSNVEGSQYPNITTAKESNIRLNGSLIAILSDVWTLTGSFGYSQSDSTFKSLDTNFQRFTDAINCVGGATGDQCFNPFSSALIANPGDPEYNDPKLIDYFTHQIVSTAKSDLVTAQVVLNGEFVNPFGGNEISVAFGGQRREESAVSDVDKLLSDGALYFLPPVQDFDVSRDVDAVFFEALIPVTDVFEVNLAGRYDSYSTGEGTFTPKASFLWRPADQLTLRGSLGTSFRVASIDQLLGDNALQNVGLDPLTGLAFNGVGVAIIPNSGLNPEEGVNWSLGGTWKPDERFSFSVDHFSINLKDRIFTETLASLVSSDPNSLRILRDGSNNIIGATLTTQNGGSFNTNGIDASASLVQPVPFGAIVANAAATYVYKYDVEDAFGNVSDGIGSYNRLVAGVAPLPKMRANVTLGTDMNNGLGVFATLRYTSKVEMDDPSLVGKTEEKSWLTADVQARYTVNDSTNLVLSVDNVTNSEPPAVGNSIYTADALLYDLRGRVWSVGIKTDF